MPMLNSNFHKFTKKTQQIEDCLNKYSCHIATINNDPVTLITEGCLFNHYHAELIWNNPPFFGTFHYYF